MPWVLLILHNPKRMKFNGLGKVGVKMMCAALCSSFADGCLLGEITVKCWLHDP